MILISNRVRWPIFGATGMKLVFAAFLALLFYAHVQGDLDDAVRRPLSMFRDDGVVGIAAG